MRKISAEKTLAVLAEVPEALMKLAQERDRWRERALSAESQLGQHQMGARMNKIASQIEQKQLEPGRSREEILEMLEKKASVGRLDAVEEAVAMSAGHRPLGSLVDVPGNGADALTGYLVGDMVD